MSYSCLSFYNSFSEHYDVYPLPNILMNDYFKLNNFLTLHLHYDIYPFPNILMIDYFKPKN